jgi:SAM-dependent methyltransferase
MSEERPAWYPDELAHAGPEHLDDAYVQGYDRKAQTDPAEDLTLLRELGLNEESTLVDLGAGTGAFALAAAPLCRRVVAVDVSPAMIDYLRRQAAERGISNVECVQAGFLGYVHEGTAPDVVYTRNALHHLPDFWKAVALARIAGLLASGGTLLLRDLVFSFDLQDAEAGIERWLRTAAVDRPEDGWTRDELEIHLRDEFSTFTWLLEPMIERAGLEIVAADHGTVGAYASYLCARPA